MDGLHISSEPGAVEATKDLVRDPLDERNMVLTGWRDYYPLCIFLRDEAGAVQGGVLGASWGRWLHVEYLYVAESLRGQGYGTLLLEAAEAEARKHGCQGVFLDSFDFQAPEFYKQYGYRVFGQLHDFPPGHTLYYLSKPL
jgi:GNAT superfamily N-acetyltransferase